MNLRPPCVCACVSECVCVFNCVCIRVFLFCVYGAHVFSVPDYQSSGEEGQGGDYFLFVWSILELPLLCLKVTCVV